MYELMEGLNEKGWRRRGRRRGEMLEGEEEGRLGKVGMSG